MFLVLGNFSTLFFRDAKTSIFFDAKFEIREIRNPPNSRLFMSKPPGKVYFLIPDGRSGARHPSPVIENFRNFFGRSTTVHLWARRSGPDRSIGSSLTAVLWIPNNVWDVSKWHLAVTLFGSEVI